MRRADGLRTITRRQFCGAVTTCIGLAAIGCTDGDLGVVEHGVVREDGEERIGVGSGRRVEEIADGRGHVV